MGGTWYWNRYPGARCDVESLDYSYTFDPELETEWEWSEKYATQAEILRYADHVATKPRPAQALPVRHGDRVGEVGGRRVAVEGPHRSGRRAHLPLLRDGHRLSVPAEDPARHRGREPVPGRRVLHSQWPHEGVDFTGKRVGVVGTGSSGIQSIPIIAEQAAELTVFQRTPNFSMPALNGPHRPEKLAEAEGRIEEYRDDARWSRAGIPRAEPELSALQVSDEERNAHYEQAWESGTLFGLIGAYNDLATNEAANDTAAEFVRSNIRSRVRRSGGRPRTAVSDRSHPFGTKRLVSSIPTTTRPTICRKCRRSLISRARTRSQAITPRRAFVRPSRPDFDFDAIVFATGFDAMTGALVAMLIFEGRNGISRMRTEVVRMDRAPIWG